MTITNIVDNIYSITVPEFMHHPITGATMGWEYVNNFQIFSENQLTAVDFYNGDTGFHYMLTQPLARNLVVGQCTSGGSYQYFVNVPNPAFDPDCIPTPADSYGGGTDCEPEFIEVSYTHQEVKVINAPLIFGDIDSYYTVGGVPPERSRGAVYRQNVAMGNFLLIEKDPNLTYSSTESAYVQIGQNITGGPKAEKYFFSTQWTDSFRIDGVLAKNADSTQLSSWESEGIQFQEVTQAYQDYGRYCNNLASTSTITASSLVWYGSNPQTTYQLACGHGNTGVFASDLSGGTIANYKTATTPHYLGVIKSLNIANNEIVFYPKPQKFACPHGRRAVSFLPRLDIYGEDGHNDHFQMPCAADATKPLQIYGHYWGFTGVGNPYRKYFRKSIAEDIEHDSLTFTYDVFNNWISLGVPTTDQAPFLATDLGSTFFSYYIESYYMSPEEIFGQHEGCQHAVYCTNSGGAPQTYFIKKEIDSTILGTYSIPDTNFGYDLKTYNYPYTNYGIADPNAYVFGFEIPTKRFNFNTEVTFQSTTGMKYAVPPIVDEQVDVSGILTMTRTSPSQLKLNFANAASFGNGAYAYFPEHFYKEYVPIQVWFDGDFYLPCVAGELLEIYIGVVTETEPSPLVQHRKVLFSGPAP